MDSRQPIAYTVCRSSIERHAKSRVTVEPIKYEWCPIKKRGLTEFTYTRYLVPWLCDYKGDALFVDADIILRADVNDLRKLIDPLAAVSVVKNSLRFEWPSVMFFNCALCKILTPEYIEENTPQDLAWAKTFAELPREWNHCVGYDEPMPDAKLVHFTQGIPCWNETRACEFSREWMEEFKIANSTVSWAELMGNSVHAKPVIRRLRESGGDELQRARV